jgi:hypothetical protein
VVRGGAGRWGFGSGALAARGLGRQGEGNGWLLATGSRGSCDRKGS